MKTLAFVLLAVLFSFAIAEAAEAVKIQNISVVTNIAPDRSFGATNFYVGVFNVSSGEKYASRAFLRFEVPSGTQVKSARLVIRTIPLNEPGFDDNPLRLSIHSITSAWIHPTWNAQPGVTLAYRDTAFDVRAAGTAEIDLTDIVNSWSLIPENNFGIMLKDRFEAGVNLKRLNFSGTYLLVDYGPASAVAQTPAANTIHTGPGLCDDKTEGRDSSGFALDSGWMQLISSFQILVITHDDCTGKDFSCPAGYSARGSIHTGPGKCDGKVEGADYLSNSLDSGWMTLCSKDDSASLLASYDDCSDLNRNCPQGYNIAGRIHSGPASCSDNNAEIIDAFGNTASSGWATLCSKTAAFEIVSDDCASQANVPEKPDIVYPLNGTVLTSTSLNLIWRAPSSVIYHFHIQMLPLDSLQEGIDLAVGDQALVEKNYYSVPKGYLQQGKAYRWRVRFSNANVPNPPLASFGPWSDEQIFLYSGSVSGKCSDGTAYGSCSALKPGYCNQTGILIEKCGKCGCPEDSPTCDHVSGKCSTVRFCEDGTEYQSCSVSKPFYCSEGSLVSNCKSCGCPPGKECDSSGNCNFVVCGDGTARNSCSTGKPYYCNSTFGFESRCKDCGCPNEAPTCKSDGKCYPKETAVASTLDVPVLVLNYFPIKDGKVDIEITQNWGDESLDNLRNRAKFLAESGAEALTRASIYKGYKNPLGVPYLNYKIVETKEFLRPILRAENPDWGYVADHYNELNKINICDYVDKKGVKQVWIFMYHKDRPSGADGQPVKDTSRHNVAPDESNMAMGKKSRIFWNLAGYGDVSNSRRINDLPTCENTYTLFEYDYGRGVGNILEDHGHQIEHVLNWVDRREETPPNEWRNLLFWGHYVGSDASYKIVQAECGWTHYAPNSLSDYDWRSERKAYSECENWNPDGEIFKNAKVVDCHTWYGAVCDDDGGEKFKIWWMQNIPGKDSGITYEGKKLRNWWEFIGDFDAAVAKGKSLVEE